MPIDPLEDPDPCPLCGRVDCGPEGDKPSHIVFEEWGEGYKAPPERSPAMTDVVATERIWEQVPIPRTKDRTRKVLRFAPGSIIPSEEAKRLNVKGDGTQSAIPTAESPDGLVPLDPEMKVSAKKAAPAKAAAKKSGAKKAGAKKAAAKKK